MAESHIAVVAPALIAAEVAKAVTGSTVHFVADAADFAKIGRLPLSAIIIVEPPPGVALDTLVVRMQQRYPKAKFIFTSANQADSIRFAAQYTAAHVPWPPTAAHLSAQVIDAVGILPRKETRIRMAKVVTFSTRGQTYSGVMLNISAGGAMVLGSADLHPGDMISISVFHGQDHFELDGTVVYVQGAVKIDYLPFAVDRVFEETARSAGIEFLARSRAGATELRRRIDLEKNSMNLHAVCIPGVPKGLRAVLDNCGVAVETTREIPASFPEPPTLLLFDIAGASLEELAHLTLHRRKSIVIGVISEPLRDADRKAIAASLPVIFVLPFQTEDLVALVHRFLQPIHRTFPRLEFPFSVLVVAAGGKRIAADGINLSLTGCAIFMTEALAQGGIVNGHIDVESITKPLPFKGIVAYSNPHQGGFRVGLTINVEPAFEKQFHHLLTVQFQKYMQVRWEQQARGQNEVSE